MININLGRMALLSIGWMLCLLGCLKSAMAAAESYRYEFKSTEQSLLFKTLTEELRCPKCQNQNLADSDSIIAKDLRQELYKLVESGNSEEEILDFMVARYGDFVLYKPPLKPSTYFLWFGPFGLLLLLVFIWWVVLRSHRRTQVATQVQDPYSDVDHQHAQKILNQGEGGDSPIKPHSQD